MGKVYTIHEIVSKCYPNNKEHRDKFTGYLVACKPIEPLSFFNVDTYRDEHIHVFKDANNRYTAIWNGIIISNMADLYDMLIEVDGFIGNMMQADNKGV